MTWNRIGYFGQLAFRHVQSSLFIKQVWQMVVKLKKDSSISPFAAACYMMANEPGNSCLGGTGRRIG